MWIVRNALRATLALRGLGVTIEAGEEFDLDALGRDTAEKSPQVAVAFEEGYLTNVFKQPADARPGEGLEHASLAAAKTSAGLTGDELVGRLDAFKQQFLDELRAQLPALKKLDELDLLARRPESAPVDLRAELEKVRKAIAADVREVVSELEVAKQRIEAEKRRTLADASLPEIEMKARLAFLEEKERELDRNFETVGHTVERADGDVMDKADLLANL